MVPERTAKPSVSCSPSSRMLSESGRRVRGLHRRGQRRGFARRGAVEVRRAREVCLLRKDDGGDGWCGRGRGGGGQQIGRRAGTHRPPSSQRTGHHPHGERRRHQDGAHDEQDACGLPPIPPASDPPHGRGQHGADRHADQPQHPGCTRVAADTGAVEDRDHPRSIGRPVDRPPEPVAEPSSEQARDGDRQEEIERQRSEPQPDGTVRRARTARRRRPIGSARTRRSRPSRYGSR